MTHPGPKFYTIPEKRSQKISGALRAPEPPTHPPQAPPPGGRHFGPKSEKLCLGTQAPPPRVDLPPKRSLVEPPSLCTQTLPHKAIYGTCNTSTESVQWTSPSHGPAGIPKARCCARMWRSTSSGESRRPPKAWRALAHKSRNWVSSAKSSRIRVRLLSKLEAGVHPPQF